MLRPAKKGCKTQLRPLSLRRAEKLKQSVQDRQAAGSQLTGCNSRQRMLKRTRYAELPASASTREDASAAVEAFVSQEAAPEPAHLLAKPSPAAKPPTSSLSPMKTKNGATAEKAKSKRALPALHAQQGSRSPTKQQAVGPSAAAGRAVIKAKQEQQDKQHKTSSAPLRQPKSQGKREPSGSPHAQQQQTSSGAEEKPPHPLDKLPPQEAEQQSFFQRLMATFRLHQQQARPQCSSPEVAVDFACGVHTLSAMARRRRQAQSSMRQHWPLFLLWRLTSMQRESLLSCLRQRWQP